MYERLIRPLLFRLSADQAHAAAQLALGVPPIWRALGRRPLRDARLETDLCGVHLANPVGLAPGFVKDARVLESVDNLGFGYITIGSFTRVARFGNPFPRLVRYPEREAIANSLGLPNKGIDAALAWLRTVHIRTPVIASVAGFSAGELLQSARAVEPYVSAVEIGLVCPNTTETERMEELRIFSSLADGLTQSIRKPIFVKLPPHHRDEERHRTFALLDECLRVGIHGVSVSGTRRHVEPRLAVGQGSIAGRPVFEDSLRVVAEVAGHSGGRLAIKASGGVFSGSDVMSMLRAGATTVEVYTSFIYRGWDVAQSVNRELLQVLQDTSVAALARRGSAAAVAR